MGVAYRSQTRSCYDTVLLQISKANFGHDVHSRRCNHVCPALSLHQLDAFLFFASACSVQYQIDFTRKRFVDHFERCGSHHWAVHLEHSTHLGSTPACPVTLSMALWITIAFCQKDNSNLNNTKLRTLVKFLANHLLVNHELASGHSGFL